MMRVGLVPTVVAALWSGAAGAQYGQQGAKLVGTGATGNAWQGSAVAVSTDGNTAIVGGYLDNAHAGAAWIFTRTGGAWTQLGNKLVASGGAPGFGQGSYQGWSVALSGDGATAIVGGPNDANGTGAAWVFTLSNGAWTQQGNKLTGADAAAGGAQQGYSVALSSDGNTAIFGGWADNSYAGAAWLFTRTGGAWSQQGPKLVGSGATAGGSAQGYAVALSSDGNTALVGAVPRMVRAVA